MLEPILKGLVEWFYGLIVEIMDYAAKELIKVMGMDLSYFESMAPVIKDIVTVIIALSWGLLLANMVFQSLKSMMSGAGFESEDPKHIFMRSFVFAFLLLASRQICDIALGMTGKGPDDGNGNAPTIEQEKRTWLTTSSTGKRTRRSLTRSTSGRPFLGA